MRTLLKQALKKIHYLLIMLVFALSACEEVIEMDLNSSAPKLVAEGMMEKDSVAWIKLSYTTDYFTTEQPTFFENATVVLTDKSGNLENLNYQGYGLYKGALLKGTANNEYTLSIIGADFKYEALSKLIAAPQILSVNFEKQVDPRPGQTSDNFSLTIRFSDDPVTENYYLIKFRVNDTLKTDNYTYLKDSYYTNVNVVEYSPMRIAFRQNDKVVINVYSIDEDSYTYYNQLNDISGSGMGGSSTPYNAKSNFGPDVLGYFMATSYDSISVMVR